MSHPRPRFPTLLVPMAIGLGFAFQAPFQTRTAAAQSPPPAEPATPGRVGLDQLLKLPDSLDFDVERRGGRTRLEWRALFADGQKSIDDAKEGLADAQSRLSRVAGRSDNWNMAPPGLPVEAAEDNPDTRALREEVARWRAEISRAEARQREITIEASLAGVPEDWRDSSVPSASDDTAAPSGRRAP